MPYLGVRCMCADYDQRQERVKRLQDQLEVALSPKLLKAFTEHNDAAARECAVTFRDMDRQNRVQWIPSPSLFTRNKLHRFEHVHIIYTL